MQLTEHFLCPVRRRSCTQDSLVIHISKRSTRKSRSSPFAKEKKNREWRWGGSRANPRAVLWSDHTLHWLIRHSLLSSPSSSQCTFISLSMSPFFCHSTDLLHLLTIPSEILSKDLPNCMKWDFLHYFSRDLEDDSLRDAACGFRQRWKHFRCKIPINIQINWLMHTRFDISDIISMNTNYYIFVYKIADANDWILNFIDHFLIFLFRFCWFLIRGRWGCFK